MTPTTPFVITFFQEREAAAYSAYQDSINAMVSDDTELLGVWHDASDMRTDWLSAYDDATKALDATPCQHTAAERSHEAQRCDWCWTISTYIRLTTPKGE
jgi:hypothetical protein